jgi:hypothetical protein
MQLYNKLYDDFTLPKLTPIPSFARQSAARIEDTAHRAASLIADSLPIVGRIALRVANIALGAIEIVVSVPFVVVGLIFLGLWRTSESELYEKIHTFVMNISTAVLVDGIERVRNDYEREACV